MSYTTQQFSAGNPPLHHLFHEIDTGKLELPDLQRPLVWKRSRIRIVELEMFDRNKPKNILIKNVFIWAVSLLMIASTTYAKQCSEPYNKNSLPYPSRQEICPNGQFFIDFFTGKRHACEAGHVDHVVPTKLLHSNGLCGGDLKNFSKDRDNLRMVHSRTNLEKSSKNPIQYAMRHSDHAELKTKEIVSKLERKGYPLSTEQMTKEAAEGIKSDLRLQYRQKNRALEQLRKRNELRKIAKRRISQRMLRSLARNVGLTGSETVADIAYPPAGKVIAFLALGALALDISDTCQNLEDLQDLDQQGGSDLETLKGAEICGMDFTEIMAMLGIDTELNNCIRARIETNAVDPDECDGIEVMVINYDAETDNSAKVVEEPSYD
jgi:hypothetical protein